MYPVRQFFTLNNKHNMMQKVEIQIGLNEFSNFDDIIGLFDQEVEPVQFASIMKTTDETYEITRGSNYNNTDSILPAFEVKLV